MVIKIPAEWNQWSTPVKPEWEQWHNQFDPSFNMPIDASSIKLDKTLTISGQAADAKAVGDALKQKQPIGNYVQKINGKVPDEHGEIVIEQEGVNFTTDETLSLSQEGVLSVNTANEAEQDNTLPITSAAVATQIGNIEIILQTI